MEEPPWGEVKMNPWVGEVLHRWEEGMEPRRVAVGEERVEVQADRQRESWRDRRER